jgi:hypothetical protein
MRIISIRRSDMVSGVPNREHTGVPILNCVPAVDRASVAHKNCVFGKEGCEGDYIFIVDCVIVRPT